MVIPVNTTFAATVVPSLFLNRIQEILAATCINAELSISGTSVLLTCGAGEDGCVVAIGGKLRWAEASKSVSFAGQPNGTYGIWFTTTVDDTDPSFTMVRSITTPAGSFVRQIGSVAWSGSTLSNLVQLAGYDTHAYMHGDTAYDALPAASISYSMLDTAITSGSIPPGAMMSYTGAAAPAGWLLCDGSAVSRATYAQLYAIVGTAYGAGDGSTTFNLPDTRGRMTVMKGTNADVDAIGENEGQATVSARTPNHVHSVPAHGHSKGTLAVGAGGSHAHTIDGIGDHGHGGMDTGGTQYVGSGGNVHFSNGVTSCAGCGVLTTAAGAHGHTIDASYHAHPNGEWSGSAGPNSNGDANLATATPAAAERMGYLTTNSIIKT